MIYRFKFIQPSGKQSLGLPLRAIKTSKSSNGNTNIQSQCWGNSNSNWLYVTFKVGPVEWLFSIELIGGNFFFFGWEKYGLTDSVF